MIYHWVLPCFTTLSVVELSSDATTTSPEMGCLFT